MLLGNQEWNQKMVTALDLINEARADLGYGELTFNQDLWNSAYEQAFSMAFFDYVGEDSVKGEDLEQRVENYGYDSEVVGQAIGTGFINPEDVVDEWLDSDAAVYLLNPEVDEAAVGYFNLGADFGSVKHQYYWNVIVGQSDGDGGDAPRSVEPVEPLSIDSDLEKTEEPETLDNEPAFLVQSSFVETEVTESSSTEGETFVGTHRNETFEGTAGDDTIDGGKGRDFIVNGAGNDDIDGGKGRDILVLDDVDAVSLDFTKTTQFTVTSDDGTDSVDRVELILSLKTGTLFETKKLDGEFTLVDVTDQSKFDGIMDAASSEFDLGSA